MFSQQTKGSAIRAAAAIAAFMAAFFATAASAAGGLLASRGEGEDLVVEQGIEMGRPSRIEVCVRGMAVSIAGPCVPVLEGTLAL